MAADALALCVTMLSSTMILTMQDKLIIVFHKEGFKLPVSSQWGKLIENANGSGHETVAVLLLGFAINW